VLARAAGLGGGRTVLVTEVDELDPTDVRWLAGLVRRADPAVLRVVLASATDRVADPLRTVLATLPPSPVRTVAEPSDGHRGADVVAHVRGLCLDPDPAARAAYRALAPEARARLHAAEARRLRATGEPTALLGPVPFHLERAGDPSAAADALADAMGRCLLTGCYERVVALGARIVPLLSWEHDHDRRWLATVKMTISEQAMGHPDEAMALYDEACAASTDQSVHMQAAYGRAMVYTRYFDESRRDLVKAKGLVNTAIALAGGSAARRRAYNRTFNENGLALIEMHLGNADAALRLVRDGIRRLDEEVTGGRALLHHAVLRYNLAQLVARFDTPERALVEYGTVIAEDPNHPDYPFERARLLEKVGRLEDAVADYDTAIRVAPPYPEPHYNRADLLARLGDLPGAVAGYGRVLELDPEFVDALVNRAGLLLELGDTEGAARDVAAGLALRPGQPHLLCLRGTLLHEDGRLAEAAEAFEQALRAPDPLAGPQLAQAWAGLGAVRFDQGAGAAARDCLEHSLGIADDPVVRENLAMLTAA
jgi:tetratricopeptide (TPR) repeat protein